MLSIGLFPSLPLSLPLSVSVRCGDGVCGQKGRGSLSLKWCWLHFSTSDKMIEIHLIKIKTTTTNTLLNGIYLSSDLVAVGWAVSVICTLTSLKRIRQNCFPSFCRCHRPFHCALGNWFMNQPGDQTSSLMKTHPGALQPNGKENFWYMQTILVIKCLIYK